MFRWLVYLLVLSTTLRLVLAWFYVGFITGDDVEILEAGISPVTDLAYEPWELRNLLLPRVLITPVAWLVTRLDGTDPLLLVRVAVLPFAGLATLNAFLVYATARRDGDAWIGVVAAGIYSLHWLPLGFGATVYPRTVSTTCVLLAFVVLLGRDRDAVRGLSAGGLISLAFAVRYSEAIFLLPLALSGWLLGLSWRRALVRGAAMASGFLVGSAITVGLVDLWTWGSPFSSLFEFARYTLVEREASSLRPDQPLFWYLRRAQFWLIPTLLPFLLVRKRASGAAAYWAMVLLPLAILSLVHHKEMRYLQGVMPFFAILVAHGAARLCSRGWRRTVVVLFLVSGLFSLRTAVQLHREKSLAAVEAATELAKDQVPGGVAVTQAWAYGDRLFLNPRIGLINFETAPSAEELRAVLRRVRVVALYTDDLERSEALRTTLAEGGFEASSRLRVGASRPVIVFQSRRRPNALTTPVRVELQAERTCEAGGSRATGLTGAG